MTRVSSKNVQPLNVTNHHEQQKQLPKTAVDFPARAR
jgi:hypothetical protein